MAEFNKADQEKDIKNYFTNLETEVMAEEASSIYGIITRFVLKRKIQNDEKHPLNILRKMILRLKESLLEINYTMDELKLIQAKFEFARDLANEVIERNE